MISYDKVTEWLSNFFWQILLLRSRRSFAWELGSIPEVLWSGELWWELFQGVGDFSRRLDLSRPDEARDWTCCRALAAEIVASLNWLRATQQCSTLFTFLLWLYFFTGLFNSFASFLMLFEAWFHSSQCHLLLLVPGQGIVSLPVSPFFGATLGLSMETCGELECLEFWDFGCQGAGSAESIRTRFARFCFVPAQRLTQDVQQIHISTEVLEIDEWDELEKWDG